MRRSCLGWDALGGMAGSSEAERSAYNRLSEGSSPSWPTKLDKIKNLRAQVQVGSIGAGRQLRRMSGCRRDVLCGDGLLRVDSVMLVDDLLRTQVSEPGMDLP